MKKNIDKDIEKNIEKSADFSSYFIQKPSLTHLNNAGLCPMNTRALSAIAHWSQRYAEEGMFCNDDYMAEVEKSRSTMASFMGAKTEQLAFFASTSMALSQLALEWPLKAGDKVLLWDQEYGSNLYPWQQACLRSGAELKTLASDGFKTPEDRLWQAALDEKVKVLSLSWLQYQSGSRANFSVLKALKAKRGESLLIVIDAIQGLGLLPLDLKDSGADALVGGSHKWLSSAVGAGYLVLSEPLAQSLRPHNFGAASFGTCDDPTDLLGCELKTGAARFEPGSRAVLEIVAMAASAELLLSCGLREMKIWQRSMELAKELSEGLSERGYRLLWPAEKGLPSPWVVVSPLDGEEKSLQKMAKRLWAGGVSFAKRGQGLRLTPHAHNSREDVRRCLQVIGEAK